MDDNKHNCPLMMEQKASQECDQGINPISRLGQIQQAQNEKEPVYTLLSEIGVPRKKEFIMQVTVQVTTQGSGSNKKQAKRAAAEKMLQLLGYSRPRPRPGTSVIKTDGANPDPDKERKVQETIGEALEMMTPEVDATAAPIHLGDSASSIMNKVQEISGEISREQLTDNKPEECSVCFNNYDDLLRPRSLQCGHTFCSQCIDNAIKNDQLTCPSCHAQYSATAATQFPISYGMEALIKKLKDTQVVPDFSKKLSFLVQEQKSNIRNLITSCQEVLSQLSEYQGQLGDWKTHHLQLQDRLYGLVEQNKSAMKLLEQEGSSVVDMTPHGVEGKTRLQAMLGSLDTVKTAQEVFMTINKVDQCNVEVEDWLQKCQKLFPDVKTVHTSVKVQETIGEALEMMTPEVDATAAPIHLGDSASSIMNKVQEISGEISREQLTVEDLRRMSEPIKRLVKAGLVFAVQQNEDGCRSARITLLGRELYLHSFLPQPITAYAHALQESEVVGVLDPFCPLAFLDLGWAGSTRGRVTIRLTPDTPLTRQFMLLCTGQWGHTYHNTKLLRVRQRHQPGECVTGGDYENNDGSGGAPLLPNLEWKYKVSRREGAVFAWEKLNSHKKAQFSIATKELQVGRHRPLVFGQVVSGLDVVRAAVNYSDITEVTVVDCGVVLPF